MDIIKKRGLILAIMLIGVFAISFMVTDSAVASETEGRWVKSHNGKWWYRYADGTYPLGKWQMINGKWYYFDSKGWMKTGWIKSAGKWYYLKTDGTLKTGWLKYKNEWYYFDKTGAMLTGRIKVNNTWYYMGNDGICLNADDDITYIQDGSKSYRKYYKGIRTSDYLTFDSTGKIRVMQNSLTIDQLRKLKTDQAEKYLAKLNASVSKEGFEQVGVSGIFDYWFSDRFPPVYGVIFEKTVFNEVLGYGGKAFVRIYRLDTGELYKEYTEDLKE